MMTMREMPAWRLKHHACCNGSDGMNTEEKIEKVNCKLCGEEIDDPFRTITADFNCINRSEIDNEEDDDNDD